MGPEEYGYTMIVPSEASDGDGAFRDTALPFSESSYVPPEIPKRIRDMRRLYEYGRETFAAKVRNFYRQGVFMQDYEDDVPWSGEFTHYFPTYHDLSIQQLRGYFTWRTQLRKGNFQPIPTSAAYLYVYELLNGIGAASPGDSWKKMQEFRAGFLDSGIGESAMLRNLKKWMLEFAVLHELPAEQAREAATDGLLVRDEGLAVLRRPEEHTDEDIFSALCAFGAKLNASPVYTADPERGMHLFAAVWREAAVSKHNKKDLFTMFFGKEVLYRWYPLSNAVFYDRTGKENRDYELDELRSYHRRNGFWQVQAFDKPYSDIRSFKVFMREADARLRRYCRTGRYLKESPADVWAAAVIDAVIEADRRALIEAARPKITIDLSELEQIRENAAVTMDSLLTEEERKESEAAAAAEAAGEASGTKSAWLEMPDRPEGEMFEPGAAAVPREENGKPETGETLNALTDLPLDQLQIRILRMLLAGDDPADLLQENHLMPSIAADRINEALFDEIGDNVLFCGDDRLSLVEDYEEDLAELLGGNT